MALKSTNGHSNLNYYLAAFADLNTIYRFECIYVNQR